MTDEPNVLFCILVQGNIPIDINTDKKIYQARTWGVEPSPGIIRQM